MGFTWGDKWGLTIQSGTNKLCINLLTGANFYSTSLIVDMSGTNIISITQSEAGKVIVMLNGATEECADSRITLQSGYNIRGSDNLSEVKYFVYNRQLTPQEIQHNFSVLNNSPSITQLQTTDAQGKTSILALGSDEDHVEMSTGRTLRQEYMGLLKRDGKEFTADISGKIEVNNGLEARVISAEIKGQTVNSCIKFLQDGSSFTNKFNNFSIDPESQYISGQTTDTSNKYQVLKVSNMNLIPDTYYTLVIEVAEFTSGKMLVNNDFVASSFVGDVSQFITSTGIFKFKIKTKPTLDAINGLVMAFHSSYGVQVGSFKFRFCLLMGDITDAINIVRMPIPFGLSSTQAIISNNGMKYPFYHPTELNEDGSKKVISLPFAEDKFTLNEDGSGTWVDASMDFIYNGDEEWVDNGRTSTHALFACKKYNKFKPFSNKTICDKAGSVGEVVVYNISGNGYVQLGFGESKFDTIEKRKQWIRDNNPSFICELATPTTTPIPKELVPTILTDKINILSVDSAVKPSSFKATVPVDKVGEMQTQLNNINTLVTQLKLDK